MSSAGISTDLEQTLRDRFGLEQFRPGQREVIENVLNRRDVLCVMPTGGGKSLCYQLPALLLGGPTLVVSPLIALMKDQVDALLERGLRATLLNSTLDLAEQKERLIEIEAGRFDLVYVAPERFRSSRFLETMSRIKPALLAVDEAHCISQWGHDFRPDYARIGHGRRLIGSPPCIALTATATDIVRRDISDQLDLNDPALFVTGFDRPNLSYAVVDARRDQEKLSALAETLSRNPGSAIVYASSRARCESIGQFLEKDLNRKAVIYHAGLGRDERTQAQDRFMSGQAQVVVATNAFGMGVDKPDIRSVIHFNLPGTLEAYYQEAGRAGRDGHPADCTLLYAPGDRFLQEMFIENEYPPPDAVFRVYEYLRSIDADPIELTHAEIKEASRVDLNESAVGTALKILEGAGGVERFRPRENMAIVRINAEADDPSLLDRVNPNAHVQTVVLRGVEGLVNRRFGESVYFHPDDFAARLGLDRPALTRALKNLAQDLPIDYVPPFRGNAVRVNDRSKRARDLVIDFKALDQRKQREYAKLDRMIKYATSTKCRRSYILGYFGDANVNQCGRCDNCGPAEGRTVTPARAIESESAREVILKVLSGVARGRGKFGKGAIAQMLIGSGSERIEKMGLTKLSTFGILPGFGRTEVAELIDSLTRSGLVETRDIEPNRPVIDISESGRDYLKAKADVPLQLTLSDPTFRKVNLGGMERITPSPAANRPAEVDTHGSDEGSASAHSTDPLYVRLKEMRLAWSRESNQSAHTIFTNKTLESLVRQRPRSPHELAAIKGVGPVLLERFGSQILEAIAAGESESPRPAPTGEVARPEPTRARPSTVADPRPTPPVRPVEPPPLATGPSTSFVPTEEWTWRLLDKGFSPDEAAAIRGLERSVIIRHATLMARKGHPIRLEGWLSTELLENWRSHRATGATEPPEGSEPVEGLWGLFLACRDRQDRTTSSGTNHEPGSPRP